MSAMLHIHDKDEQHVGNLCVPGPFQYLPRVHRINARQYDLLGEPSRSLKVAMRRLSDAMVADWSSRRRRFNRGDVLAVEKDSYYEPHVVFEVKP